MQKSLITLFFILVCSVMQGQKKMSLSGYVNDKLSGESLPGAHVLIVGKGQGTTTNQYGYYSMITEQSKIEVKVSFVGYQTIHKSFILTSDTTINFGLEILTLQEIIIHGFSSKTIQSEPNRFIFPIARLKEIPPFLGEYDIMKELAMMPGVSTGTEGSSGLYVRGGTPDQNLLLLDGATVYNNSHLFGFISIFNPEAISNVELIKGGYPARYGGRLSSVINIQMKEGNLKERQSSFSIGPISSQFTTEGPIRKDKSSYLISGRSAYLSVISVPLYFLYKAKSVDNYINYWMYDLNVKVNHSFNNNKKIFASFYTGKDVWISKNNESSGEDAVKFKWGNTTSSIRLTNAINSDIFSISQICFNQYSFDYNIGYLPDPPSEYNPETSIFIQSKVQDISLKKHYDITLVGNHRISAGIELKHQLFIPDYYRSENVNFGQNIPHQRENRHEVYDAALYIENKLQLSSRLDFNTGLRYSNYFVADKSYHYIEPRIQFNLTRNSGTVFNLAYSIMHQPLHLLSNTGQGLPIDVWAPITSKFNPQTSHQWSAGFKIDANKLPLSFTFDTYYKKLNNLVDYKAGFSFVTNVSSTWQELLEKNGDGKSYGFELLISKDNGKFRGWLEYTLSWNWHKFQNINKGKWYPSNFDRRHDLGLTAIYNLSDKWDVSSTLVYSSGKPSTLPTAIGEDIFGKPIKIYTERNNQRMPAYHRLDVAVKKIFITKRGRQASISFGAYNAYARINPFYIDLIDSPVFSKGDTPRALIGHNSVYESGTLFGIVPFFNYSIKF